MSRPVAAALAGNEVKPRMAYQFERSNGHAGNGFWEPSSEGKRAESK